MLQASVIPVTGYVWKPVSHILSSYLFVIRHIVGILDVKSILKQQQTLSYMNFVVMFPGSLSLSGKYCHYGTFIFLQ
jgi:hypothetical protein